MLSSQGLAAPGTPAGRLLVLLRCLDFLGVETGGNLLTRKAHLLHSPIRKPYSYCPPVFYAATMWEEALEAHLRAGN